MKFVHINFVPIQNLPPVVPLCPSATVPCTCTCTPFLGACYPEGITRRHKVLLRELAEALQGSQQLRHQMWLQAGMGCRQLQSAAPVLQLLSGEVEEALLQTFGYGQVSAVV